MSRFLNGTAGHEFFPPKLLQAAEAEHKADEAALRRGEYCEYHFF